MDLVKRNAEIVALVKARKMPMREIAARYRLSTSSISLIAIRHGIHAQAADRARDRHRRGADQIDDQRCSAVLRPAADRRSKRTREGRQGSPSRPSPVWGFAR